MSLVLNTNEGSGMISLNDGLTDTLPEGFVALKPSFPSGGLFKGGNVLDVNGTTINLRFADLLKGYMETGTGGMAYGGFGNSSSNEAGYPFSQSWTFATKGQLKGGEVIGKTINATVRFLSGGSSTYDGVDLTATITIKLLHTDGTYTVIGSLSMSYKPTGTGSQRNTKSGSITTNGVVALSGDRIVAQIDTAGSIAGNLSRWGYPSFGRDGGTSNNFDVNADNFGPLPIFVSIE